MKERWSVGSKVLGGAGVRAGVADMVVVKSVSTFLSAWEFSWRELAVTLGTMVAVTEDWMV